jgi:hypothetical protein
MRLLARTVPKSTTSQSHKNGPTVELAVFNDSRIRTPNRLEISWFLPVRRGLMPECARHLSGKPPAKGDTRQDDIPIIPLRHRGTPGTSTRCEEAPKRACCARYDLAKTTSPVRRPHSLSRGAASRRLGGSGADVVAYTLRIGCSAVAASIRRRETSQCRIEIACSRFSKEGQCSCA